MPVEILFFIDDLVEGLWGQRLLREAHHGLIAAPHAWVPQLCDLCEGRDGDKLLLLFLCASFVVFFKPTKTNDDIQNTYNVFNNNNLLSTNNGIYDIQYDTIKTSNINIKKTTPTPIHNQ